ncbi:MAG: 23S rRNA (uracil(1939)-C(5))-methyltransferase RlmD [Ignavibacteriales bacterium]|nr:23S rRNA (uracil(1939)-C(5))-methyltransferase RlmD [Ignavibacteriales bacterium]
MIPPRKNDELTVEISSAAFEGKSVARVDGYVLFVEGAVPGDVALVRIIKTRKQHGEAKILQLVTPSPLRVSPRCPYVGTCGGCKWQHVDYSAQLRFKEQQVRESFERIGGFRSPDVLPIIGSDEIFFYRNKMEFSFSEKNWKSEIENRKSTISQDFAPQPPVYLGLHVPRRYDKVLDIQECHLQSVESTSILNFTRAFARASGLPVYSSEAHAGYFRFLVVRQSKRTGDLMVNLVTFEDRPNVMRQYAKELRREVPSVTTVVNTINEQKAQIAFGDREQVIYGDGVIREKLGRHMFMISAASFFQTNTAQAEKLYGVAREFAGLTGAETVFDLYSGTGTIALFISDRSANVVGIDSLERSVRDAELNTRNNGVKNCAFLVGDMKDRLTKDTGWMKSFPKPDVLLIDPPRSGMHPGVVDGILKLDVPRIVYISCNPVTQARDVALLCRGRYRLLKLQPVDMFPHTYHIECVALIERV